MEVVVFLTEEAWRKNWQGKEDSAEANFDQGLGQRLQALRERMEVEEQRCFCVKTVRIPDGSAEDEIWEIFRKITQYLSAGDRIILDITHSFRSLPMLSLVALHYARFLYGVSVEKIVYAAMEALGPLAEVKRLPPAERSVPVFDLTPFVEVLDWTMAVEKFLNSGDAGMIRALGMEELQPLLAATQGKVGGKVRRLIKTLDLFANNVATCRAPRLLKNIRDILHTLPEAQRELQGELHLEPLQPLVERIKTRFQQFDLQDEVQLGIGVAEWCAEKGLIQQGFTILRETIVNYAIATALPGQDLEQEEAREEAEELLNAQDQRLHPEAIKLWRELIEYRNDLNHAAWARQNQHSAEDFRTKLQSFIRQAREVLW